RTSIWSLSSGGEFNNYLSVSYNEKEQRTESIDYNYWPMYVKPVLKAGGKGFVAELAATTGTDAATYQRELPGMSAFALEGGVVYHTYSTYARGLDALWGMYQWLDRAPKGRNEAGVWWRRHDEYEKR